LRYLEEDGWRIARNRKAKPVKYSTIGYYIHTNQRMGAMVELCCETDLTASAEFFNRFANEIAMHIAVKNPRFLSSDDIPQEEDGRIDVKKECLLEQDYIKNENKTINGMIMEFIYKHKENTEIKRFSCFQSERQI